MVSIYDVLKASKGIHVEDSFAEIWGRKLRGGYEIKTLTGVPPLEFNSAGEPLIDWVIHGNVTQDDSPTPYDPDYPVGVGEKTDNLFNAATVTNERITWSTGATFSADGYRLSDYIPVETTQTYTCSTNVWFVGYDANKTYLGTYNEGAWDKNGLKTATQFVNSATLGAAYIRLLKQATSVSTIMLNTGSTALPYEPFGYKIPITCGGQTTNIYLGSVVSTRRVKKLVLTGEETVSSVAASSLDSGAYCFVYLYSNLNMTDIKDYDRDMRVISYPQYMSSHFVTRPEPTTRPVGYVDLYAGQIGANAIKESGGSNWTYNRYIIFCVSGISTINDFKAWLAAQYAAGTPVTIWYITNERQTASVNEPLMKIGSYVDELTKTGTGVNIPTTNGSNTLTVGTTVQPSSMSITFKGK